MELREILTQVLDERGIARGAARRVPLRRGHAVGRDHKAQRVLVQMVASGHVQKLFELAEARVDPRHQVGRALRSHRVDGRDAALDARGVALGPVDEHVGAVRVGHDAKVVVGRERRDEGVGRVLGNVKL